MKNTYQEKQVNKKSTIGLVVAEVAGAVALTGVAVAATLALKDEKSREKVKKVLNEVKGQALDYIDKHKTQPDSEEAVKMIKKIVTDKKRAM